VLAAEARLDEILVTAARRPASASDMAIAVTLIEADGIEAKKLATDALDYQLGVSLQQTTPGQGAAIIRGLKGSALLHLVDGMPLSNAMFRSAPTPFLSYVPITAIERIEVVRGTPATLYGSQAVGGVVQVVTRRPTFTGPENQVRAAAGTRLDTAEQLRSIRASADFGNEYIASTISGEYFETGDRRVGGGERIVPSGYRSEAGRFAMAATPSDSHSWYFDLHYLEQPNTPRVDELVAGFGQTEPASSEFIFSPSRRVFAHIQYDFDHIESGIDWRADAAWQRVDDDHTTRDFESQFRQFEQNRSDLFAASLSASGGDRQRNWIAGLDVQSDTVSSARDELDISTLGRRTLAPRFPDGSRINQAAIFVHSDVALSDKHSLAGGLRVSDVRIEVPTTEQISAANIDVRRLSGDIGWIYYFKDGFQLVGNAGAGFRAPNIADIGTLGNRPGNRFNEPNTDLDAEEVLQLDFGLRHDSERTSFELSLYTLRYSNRIVSVLTGATTSEGRDIVRSTNIADSRISGVEAQWSVSPTDRTYLSAVVNYTYGTESFTENERQPADRIPPLSGRLLLQVDINDEWLIETQLAAAYRQDRLSDRDVNDSRINPLGTPGWSTFGVAASWIPSETWRVDLGIDNIFDQRYRVHGSGIDASGVNFSVAVLASW
jgi:outer membrane receptor protein involved in Fe transport